MITSTENLKDRKHLRFTKFLRLRLDEGIQILHAHLNICGFLKFQIYFTYAQKLL